MYAVKIGIAIELVAGAVIFIFAPQITSVFTYSEAARVLAGDITTFLRYTALFYPSVPLGMLTSALFRGINQGMNALIVTLIRTVVLQVSIAYLLGITLDYGLEGVWGGIVAGNLIAGIAVTFPWGCLSLRRFRQQVALSQPEIS